MMGKDDFLKSEMDDNLSKDLNEDESNKGETKLAKKDKPEDQEYPTDNQKSSAGPEEKDITV